jgi:hypothetical protein
MASKKVTANLIEQSISIATFTVAAKNWGSVEVLLHLVLPERALVGVRGSTLIALPDSPAPVCESR